MAQKARQWVVNSGLGTAILILVLLLTVRTRTQEQGGAPRMSTPQGVRLLENKSFDDSGAARREILDLYKNLRLTDVCDGMDLIGLQDIKE